MRNRMDATNFATNIREFKQSVTDDPAVRSPSWIWRQLENLGVIDMAPSTRPPGFFVNWTTVTGILAIFVFFGGICAGLWQIAYQQGQMEAERLQLIERLNKAEADAAEAKKFSIYATAGADEAAGHKPNQKLNQKETK